MKNISLMLITIIFTFTLVFANQELHSVWYGGPLKEEDLESVYKIYTKNPHVKQFLWMDRAPTEEEKIKLTNANVTIKHVKELDSRLKEFKNTDAYDDMYMLLEISKLEANTKYGKAFANNIFKELVIQLGGSEENQYDYVIAKDFGARFINDMVPDIKKIEQKDAYHKMLFEKNSRGYFIDSTKETNILFGFKGEGNLVNNAPTFIAFYAIADWKEIYEKNNYLRYEKQANSGMLEGFFEVEKPYNKSKLLNKAHENIKYRELWAKKHAPLILSKDLNLLGPEGTVSVMKNFGDLQYSESLFFNSAVINLNFNRNHDNRRLSWCGPNRPIKANLNSKQRAESVLNTRGQPIITYSEEADILCKMSY